MRFFSGLIKKSKGNLQRKERRRSLSKRLSLALACLLSFNILPMGNMKVKAEELTNKVTVNGMSTDEYNDLYQKYLDGDLLENRAIGNSGLGISLVTSFGYPVIAPPITIDGEVAYCMNRNL